MARPPLTLETWGEINTTKLGTGKYRARARYRDIDGVTRPVERLGRTKSEAIDKLKSALRDRLGPLSGEDITRETTIASLADVWWKEWRDEQPRAVGSVLRYKSVLDGHVVKSLGSWRIQECTVGKLDRFIKTMTENVGYSSAAIASVLLTGMLNLAARRDAIDANPMAAVAKVPIPESQPTAFSLEDVAELRAILAEWDAGMDRSGRQRVSDLADPVDAFLATGARPGEIFAMSWPLIDLSKTPTLATLRDTMAKDLNGRWRVQHQRKNHKVLEVKLPKFATDMLLRRRVHATTDFVFPSSTGTPRIPDNFRTQWHAALKGTRFEGRLPKEFRSTVATFLRDEDGIETAQQQLNHASLTTTEQRYGVPIVTAPDVSAILEKFVAPMRPSGQSGG